MGTPKRRALSASIAQVALPPRNSPEWKGTVLSHDGPYLQKHWSQQFHESSYWRTGQDTHIRIWPQDVTSPSHASKSHKFARVQWPLDPKNCENKRVNYNAGHNFIYLSSSCRIARLQNVCPLVGRILALGFKHLRQNFWGSRFRLTISIRWHRQQQLGKLPHLFIKHKPFRGLAKIGLNNRSQLAKTTTDSIPLSPSKSEIQLYRCACRI
jgi:hypothetical protein